MRMSAYTVGIVSMEHAVTQALAVDGGPVTERDVAAKELALFYARAIDADAEMLDTLGPKLLQALESLLLTPRARAAALRKGAPGDPNSKSPLDDLRARRARRDGA